MHCYILISILLAFCIFVESSLHLKKSNQTNEIFGWEQNDLKWGIRESSLGEQWESFKSQFKKSYKAEEEILRQKVWLKNLKYVYEHNKAYKAGFKSFTVGVNEYADLTFEEYRKYLLGARPPKDHLLTRTNLFRVKDAKSVPDSVDWRAEGYVTPIKNQGQCGSCWAFSSTGALEGMHFRRTGYLVEMSEQNLVDCTLKYGNAGCGGGWMNNAFRYVRENNGIDDEQDYPYQAKTGRECHYNPDYSGTTVSGHVDIGYGLEEDLQGASATLGPIAVAIDATHQSFQLYKSGVYYEPKCQNTTSDHAVLVVGYGTDNGADYWLVKNSWGTSWGQEGYIKMSRNRNNNCAIASFASVPLEYY